ncbi:MAG: hypothetical protein KJO60_12565 [Desulfofustis sp.]|nr:hypothetical protein [Desulfofustis sp.]RZW20188.1 MAG: hypothetical protein EX260_06870 [Desulfobulbaceae bacterium]MBT8345850.1 hypothetical protein [Desulfofustis sp.]MBT8355352.1 hypothetical protein [Desulfofustis sp.]NNF47674.1 hypothetical protein [Desulfofustis sp.]
MMQRSLYRKIVLILGSIALTIPGLVIAAGDISGWEVGSEYNELYDPKERDSIKGDIVKFIKVTPLKGMAPGTAFILDEGGGDQVVVHVCPESYASSRETGLRRGDWVKVKGVWADIGDESVFLAAKIRKDNDYAFKVRLTSDGTPFWTMTPEMLAMEKAAVE